MLVCLIFVFNFSSPISQEFSSCVVFVLCNMIGTVVFLELYNPYCLVHTVPFCSNDSQAAGITDKL